MFHTSGEADSLTHSFPLQEKSWAEKVSFGIHLCCLWGWVTWVKSNCSSFSLQGTQTIFLALILCWYFSAGNLRFCKGSQVCGLLSKMVLYRGFWTVAEKGCIQFTVHSDDWSLSPYYPIHRWARLLLVSWHMLLDPMASTKALLFMDGCQMLLKGVTAKTTDQSCCWHYSSRNFWSIATWGFFCNCSVHVANVGYLPDG